MRQFIHSKRFIAAMLSLCIFSLIIPFAQAGQVNPPVINSAVIGCTSATVTYESEFSFGQDFADISIINATTSQVIATTTGSPFGDTVTLTYPAQPPGSFLFAEVSVGQANASSRPVAVSCTEGEDGLRPYCPDGRINYRDCEPVAIYPVQDEDGVGILVYVVKREDKGVGEFGFFVSFAELNALPENPEEPILIAETDDGFAQLYKLPSGEYQVNAGPDDEGKVFEFRFSIIPGEYPEIETWFVSSYFSEQTIVL